MCLLDWKHFIFTRIPSNIWAAGLDCDLREHHSPVTLKQPSLGGSPPSCWISAEEAFSLALRLWVGAQPPGWPFPGQESGAWGASGLIFWSRWAQFLGFQWGLPQWDSIQTSNNKRKGHLRPARVSWRCCLAKGWQGAICKLSGVGATVY